MGHKKVRFIPFARHDYASTEAKTLGNFEGLTTNAAKKVGVNRTAM